MNTKILFFILLMLFSTLVIAQVQNFSSARPDIIKKIHFGEKQPSPDEAKKILGINKNQQAPNDASSKKTYLTLYDKQMLSRDASQQGFDFRQRNNRDRSGKDHASADLNFHLTKDINALTESFPYNLSNNIYSYAILNSVSYFSADNGIHGYELWRSDGTSGGTYIVKDINPGESSSYPTEIIAANGKLFFSAEDSDNGKEAWISDGTDAGTHLLIDINPGIAGSDPTRFVSVNNVVFFIANGSELWKTDGSVAGTVLIKELRNTEGAFEIFQPVSANGLLFFTANSNSFGRQLWRSDGTYDGTFMVKQIGSFADIYSAPLQLTEYNNKLCFSADDGTGRKLWMSDGTEAGTSYAPGNNDILIHSEDLVDPNYDYNTPFKILNNVLYISGYKADAGDGLYKYDASNTDGVVLVKDLTDLSGYDLVDYVYPLEMTVVNDELYFEVVSNINGWHEELWKSDGETDHTQRIKTFAADAGVFTYNYYYYNGELYFDEYDTEFGTELWKSDGTEQGTYRLKDIFTGDVSSRPLNFTVVNGKFLFSAVNAKYGRELWTTNGTSAGTELLKDINTTTTSSSYANFYGLSGAAPIGDKLVFRAYEREHGIELYGSDGTKSGTSLIADLTPGENNSTLNYFSSKNNEAYLAAFTSNGNHTTIYKTDGTISGTKKVVDIITNYLTNYAAADNGIVFYVIYNFSSGFYELWRSDGTSAGTYLLTSNMYYNNGLVTTGNIAFFVAGDDAHGYELWKSNGSVGGTKMVEDIYKGNESSVPYSLFAYEKNVYFGADDGTGYSFWKSNGYTAIKLKDVSPEVSYNNNYYVNGNAYCVSGNELYFVAYEKNYDKELYKTKGGPDNTTLVKNINPYFGSDIGHLTDVNGTLFFTADDGLNYPNRELWSSTGTDAGTKLVKVFTQSGDYSFLDNLCSTGGKLFFLIHDYFFYPNFSDNVSFWSSDGTEAGTGIVNDPVVNDLSKITDLISAGNNKLFFGGYSYKYGAELYVGTVNDQTGKLVMSRTANDKVKIATPFNAVLYPNPAISNASLQITGNTKNVSISITDMSGRKLWQSNNSNAMIVNLPTDKFAAGAYIVTIKSHRETKTIKLVKQ